MVKLIPKKIHYCWFGGKEKPELVKKCMASWKKHLPDYELIEWNENNFDINCTTFVREAYENRNFAFVSDYVRAKKLFEIGGVYLDTDVEVLKSFDRFLEDDCFVGFEEKQFVGTCVIGAVAGTDILKSYAEHYESISFIQPDGSKYKDTNVVLLTDLLEKYGLVRNDEKQTVHGVTVYPRTFFSPYDYINGINYITDDSYAIHHFAQLWLPLRERIGTTVKRKIIKVIGGNAWAKLRGR
ncbi:MAG: glycosyl transferase [Clostridiales bacterium]|nr:glycosyl transferase [Clostridiales bacterium]